MSNDLIMLVTFTRIFLMNKVEQIDTDCLPGNKTLIRALGGSMRELQEYRKKYGGSLHGAGNILIGKAYI